VGSHRILAGSGRRIPRRLVVLATCSICRPLFIQGRVWIKFPQAVRAESVAELGLGMSLDVTLQWKPFLVLILDPLAGSADR